MSKNDNNKKQNNKNYFLGFGMAFGLIGGALFATIIGIFIESPIIWAFGPGLGMLIGIVIGSLVDYNHNKE